MPQMGPSAWVLIISLSWMTLVLMYFSISDTPLLKATPLPPLKSNPMIWQW